ncbi:putative bifunctional diguanylate cyclase/phosphodiesterase [Ectobacillus ponti]|uniref:EAL domain-containing protein n=1 Tax=Ectobacillus ponti TaxID=2961894 RepID=A0AA41X327_9BACI|nr:EAL domain-containing protein [Ectobacillus ponti]MCP8967807.1 EAL domain-containing protein [Ectobacillus ponti]
MSIRNRVSWLFTGLVACILICNNALHLYWLKDILLGKERQELRLISNTVAYQIQQADAGALYVEGLLGEHLRTASIAARLALPPKAADISNRQLQGLAHLLGVDEITLFQPTPDGKEVVGVKSTDEKEIGLTTGEWGFWNDAFLQLMRREPITVGKGQVLPSYWSGPIEIAASDPDHVDKYGYYFDGATDYMINPFMRDARVLTYERQFGPSKILEQIQQSTEGVLDITVFNPDTFGKSDVAVQTNGNTYTRLKDAPVVAGSYWFPKKQKDMLAIRQAVKAKQPAEYRADIAKRDILKMFYPIQVDGNAYVVAISFDYGVIEKELLKQLNHYLGLSLLILLGIIPFARFFAASLTNPMQRIVRKVNEIASGRFGERIYVKGKNEITVLANSVNMMSTNLQAFTEELRQKQELIEHQANHDPLTNLPNRRYMQAYVNDLLNQAQHTAETVALFFVDIDNFKLVNDVQGHNVGDELIQILGARLRSCLPEHVFIARQGGDEFILAAGGITSHEQVHELADQVLRCLQVPFVLDERELLVQVSIGGSLFSEHANTLESLIRFADIAMYDAKKQGGNQFVMYGMAHSAVEEELALQDKLAHAIEKKTLDVYFQPKVSLQHGGITGAEVLVRWFDPDMGFISPITFIPIAEKTGLISQLWEVVMEKACRHVQEWRQLGYEVPIAVNFSAGQFADIENMTERLQSILAAYGIPAGQFEMEITESALMEQGTTEALHRIKTLGISISVDDFGTGYSSLSYLDSFPLDTLKVDRSFIDGIEENERKRQIAELIVSLAKRLELKVVAEGVETEGQRQLLQEWQCDEMQGYLFSKPLQAQDLLQLLQNHSS